MGLLTKRHKISPRGSAEMVNTAENCVCTNASYIFLDRLLLYWHDLTHIFHSLDCTMSSWCVSTYSFRLCVIVFSWPSFIRPCALHVKTISVFLVYYAFIGHCIFFYLRIRNTTVRDIFQTTPRGSNFIQLYLALPLLMLWVHLAWKSSPA